MCGKSAPKRDPAWKTASAKDTANRGAEPLAVDQPRRIGATGTDPGSVLGGSGTAPTTASVLGG